MNRDAIERALRQPGPREGGYLPAALPLGADAERSNEGRGSLLAAVRMGLLTAALVGGATLAVILTRGGAPQPGNQGTGAGSAEPSVAASLPPATASLPLATGGACRAEDFAWSVDPWTGAAGSRGTSVLLRGVSGLAGCQIDGSPLIVLRDAQGVVLLSAHGPASTVAVRADTLLEAGISWSNWCGADPAAPLSMTLTLPGDTHEVPLVPATGPIQVPPCMGSGQPSVLNATDFQPSDRTPPEG